MDSPKMLSILQIDRLSKRYGILPSEVLRRSDTFDLYVMDAAMSFERYHQKKANANGKPIVPDLSQDQLLKILKKNKQQ